jgi:hypothetical protein
MDNKSSERVPATDRHEEFERVLRVELLHIGYHSLIWLVVSAVFAVPLLAAYLFISEIRWQVASRTFFAEETFDGPRVTVTERNSAGIVEVVSRKPVLRLMAPTSVRVADKPFIRATIENADTANYSGVLTCLSCDVVPKEARPPAQNREWTWRTQPTSMGTMVVSVVFEDANKVYPTLSGTRDIQVGDEYGVPKAIHDWMALVWLVCAGALGAFATKLWETITSSVRRVKGFLG